MECGDRREVRRGGKGGLPGFLTLPSMFLMYSVGEGAAVEVVPLPLLAEAEADVDATAIVDRAAEYGAVADVTVTMSIAARIGLSDRGRRRCACSAS